MPQKPVRAYLDPELAEEITRRAQALGRSESAFIADVLRARLAATSEETQAAEAETTRRQLARVEARLDKLIWEQLQTKQCFLLFIRVWLEHNPPLDADVEESAAISAEARFERFLDLLANQLTNSQDGADIDARVGVGPMNGADNERVAP